MHRAGRLGVRRPDRHGGRPGGTRSSTSSGTTSTSRTNEVTVRNKPRKYDHKVKDRQERTIGIDPALMGRLRNYIEGASRGAVAIVPGSAGRRRASSGETHEAHRQGGLASPVPKKPNHAFRVSYATRLNRSGHGHRDGAEAARALRHQDHPDISSQLGEPRPPLAGAGEGGNC